jgi:hypothetical protein
MYLIKHQNTVNIIYFIFQYENDLQKVRFAHKLFSIEVLLFKTFTAVFYQIY